MRIHSMFLLFLLLATALLTAGCLGPDDPQQQLALACERQVEEVQEGHSDGTAEAKSSEEAGEAEALVECAGQAAHEAPAAEDGEGTGEETTPVTLDPEAREAFVQSCGSCHELSDAETTGAVGPNLDETTMTAEEITAQIEQGGGAMPAGLLEGEDAAAVGEYVAGAAAE